MIPLVGATAAQAATTHRGGYGQQIAVSTHFSDEVEICGRNQRLEWKCSPHFRTPGKGYTKLRGWWWRGPVTIKGYNDNSSKVRTMKCWVPQESQSDWKECDGRSRKRL